MKENTASINKNICIFLMILFMTRYLTLILCKVSELVINNTA